MYSSDLLNDEGYASKAQMQNRLLIESGEVDDGYLRKGGGGGQLLAPAPQLQRRNPAPLIEEESESKPFLMSHGKANMARQFYDRTQASKKPWKRGMPYSQSTLDMFDSSTPYEKKMFGGIKNPRQAVNLEANRPGGFQKLFGAKMSKNEIADREEAGRAPAESFWGRLKNAVTGGGRKRSWMEMFFGARKRKPSNSAKSMGITSTNAKKGVSSGWADQLVEASREGKLGDGREGGVMSEELIRPQEEQKQADRSFEDYIEDEEKVPAAPSKQLLLTAKEAKRNSFMGNLYAMQQLNAADKSGKDGNPHQTVDDNSIDESDDGGYGGDGGYDKQLLNNYMQDDDMESQDRGKPDFIRDFSMGLLKKK